MPPRKRGKVDGGASPEAGGGGIGGLPEDALHHVLSFLPAEEAVRTSVLARSWRHLWKSATGLRIGCGGDGDEHEPPSVEELRQFVDRLLDLREQDSSLDTCEFRIGVCRCGDDERRLNLWIRRALACKVRMLRVDIQEIEYDTFWLDGLSLVSKHLTTLALIGVGLSILNLSTCPNLENLEISNCRMGMDQISSESLKRLSITNHSFFDGWLHTRICVPSLVSLRLDIHLHAVPVLGSMPSLKEAFVREDDDEGCQFEYCYSCSGELPDDDDHDTNKCFLLEGLSKAENLALMSYYKRVIFQRDLEWCPTFTNLRTLLLNQCWFVDNDFNALTCILNHSPVLEKLALHLFFKQPKHNVEMIGTYNQMEGPATISKHLKEVKVKYKVLDAKVRKILQFLSKFGICK
ncbi:hypothetical protein ACP70R_003854 [Stipagrostis hirtigluma subsp. patula]